MFQTMLAFLFIFSVIVVFHEFGHFYFAKRAGILVREFAIGMGPKLIQFRKGETVYTLRLLPIGGYVRMAGHGDEEIECKPGMTVGIELEANTVEKIHLNEKTMTSQALQFQVDSCDLETEMTLKGMFLDQMEVQTLPVSKRAIIVESDGTELYVAPIERQFQSAPLVQRMLTNFGGPLNNFILAIFTFILIAFLKGGVANDTSLIGQVIAEGPAARAGILSGDLVTKVDGKDVSSWSQLAEEIMQKPNQAIQLTVLRDEQTKEITVQTESTKVEEQEVGRIGIEAATDTSFWAKISYGFKATLSVSTLLLTTLASFFTKGFSLNQLGGPIAMVSVTSQVVQNGFIQVLNFMALISVNLGVMNLLPVPVLDGGKLVLNIIEGVRGKPLDPDKENYVTIIGAICLIALMLIVTWNDIMRLF